MPSPHFVIAETPLRLEELPANVILVHATNCLGEWGAGFAKAVAKMFPEANEMYASFCDDAKEQDEEGEPGKWPMREKIIGKCYLIDPQKGDFESTNNEAVGEKRKRQDEDEAAGPKIWIGCLFTSYGYGRGGGGSRGRVRGRGRGRGRGGGSGGKPGKDSTDQILEQTRMSLRELRQQLDSNEMKTKCQNGEVKMEIYSPQFNSGSFKVPWEDTEEIIREEFKGWEGKWYVMKRSK